MAVAPQTPQTDASVLSALAAEPALVVLLLAGVAVLVAATVLLRWRRAVRQARARGAIEDWLLGAEEALCGQVTSARERLQRVLVSDPENHGARTLLAETLLLLREPAAAHEHFLTLSQAFGVAGRRVTLGRVRALVDAGRAVDAVELLARLPRDDDVATLRLRLTVELAAGLPADTARTAERLRANARTPADGELAQCAAERAFVWQRTVLAHGKSPADGASPAPRLPAQLTDATIARPRTALAVTVATGALGPVRTTAEAELHQLAADVAAAPYVCACCGIVLPRALPRCPHCDARHAPRLREPLLHRELASVSAVADEVEENEAHAGRLLERVLAGDAEARVELIEAGARTVPAVFRRALADASAREKLIPVLQGMGSGVLDALLGAYEQARGSDAVAPAQREAAPAIVGCVVQAFGPAALPAFQARLDTDDHDLRKIVVDFFLGLDDVEELQSVLERYPPVEVIQRLNVTPPARLQAWLVRVPERGLLAEVVLSNPMFVRDEDVLLAAAQAPSPDALLALLRRRGASHDLATFAVARLHDDAVAGVAERLLQHYGRAAADALLAGYLDLDRPAAARDRARRLLAALGAAVVPQVCQCFGASPARLDDELVALLVALGDDAIPQLLDVYTRRNLLERVGGRFVRRYNHPRNVMVKVLARIGGAPAHAALLRLRADESDPNLKLRLDQALQVVARAPALPSPARPAERREQRRTEEAG